MACKHIGHGNRDQVARRAQHHAHDHAGQQQPQRVMHALGQRQREQHAQHRTDKGGTRQPQARHPLRGEG
jgi:hypothetical protein